MAGGQRWISRQFDGFQFPQARACSPAVQFQSFLFIHPFPCIQRPSSINWAKVPLTLILLKIIYSFVCWALNFFKKSINLFWWHNFHNAISWLARKRHFSIITFPSGTIISVPFSLTITLLFKRILTPQGHIYYFHCLLLWKEIFGIESVPHNS